MKRTLALSNDRSESKRIEKAWVGTAMFVAVLAATLISVSLTPAHAVPKPEIDPAEAEWAELTPKQKHDLDKMFQASKQEGELSKEDIEAYERQKDDKRINQALINQIKAASARCIYNRRCLVNEVAVREENYLKTTTVPSHLFGPDIGPDLPDSASREQRIAYLKKKAGPRPSGLWFRQELEFGDTFGVLRKISTYLNEDDTEYTWSEYYDMNHPFLQATRQRYIDEPLGHHWEVFVAAGNSKDPSSLAEILKDVAKNQTDKGSKGSSQDEWERIRKELVDINAIKAEIRTKINSCQAYPSSPRSVINLIAKLRAYERTLDWHDRKELTAQEIEDFSKDLQEKVLEPHSRYQAAVQDLQTIIPSLQADCDFDPARKHLRAVGQAMLGVRAECRVPDYSRSLSDMSDRIDIMEGDKDGGYKKPLKRAEEVVSNFETDLSTSANLQGTQRCKNIESTIGMLGDFSVGPFDYAASGIAKNACNEPKWAVERRAKVEAHAQSLLAKAKASLADDQGAPKLLEDAAAAIAECEAPAANKLLTQFDNLPGSCDATLASRGVKLRQDTDALMTGIEDYAKLVSAAHIDAQRDYDSCSSLKKELGPGRANPYRALVPVDANANYKKCYSIKLSEAGKKKIMEIGAWDENNREARQAIAKLEFATREAPVLTELCRYGGAAAALKIRQTEDKANYLHIFSRDCVQNHAESQFYEDLKRKLEKADEVIKAKRADFQYKKRIADSNMRKVAKANPPTNSIDAENLQGFLDEARKLIGEIRGGIKLEETKAKCFTQLVADLDEIESIEIPFGVEEAMAVMQDPEALRRVAAGTAHGAVAAGGTSESEPSKGKLSAQAAKSQGGDTSGDESPPAEDAQIAIALRAMNECRFSDADLEISKVKSSGSQTGLMAELARLRARENDISRSIDEAFALEMQENYGAALAKLRSLRSQCHGTQRIIDNRIARATLAQTQAQERRFAAAGAALDDCDYARFESHYAQLPDGERKGELSARKAAALSRDAAVNELFQRGTGLVAKGAFAEAVASLEKASGMARCAADRTRVTAALARAKQGAAQVAALQCGPNASKHFNAGSGLPECVCNAGFTPAVKGNGCSNPFAELKARFEEEDRQQKEQEAAYTALVEQGQRLMEDQKRYTEDQWRRRLDEQEGDPRDLERRRWEREQQVRLDEEELYQRDQEQRRWDEEERRWEEEERRRWEEEDRYFDEQQREMERLYDEESRRQREEQERGWKRNEQIVREIERGGKVDYAAWCAAHPGECKDRVVRDDPCADALLGNCY